MNIETLLFYRRCFPVCLRRLQRRNSCLCRYSFFPYSSLVCLQNSSQTITSLSVLFLSSGHLLQSSTPSSIQPQGHFSSQNPAISHQKVCPTSYFQFSFSSIKSTFGITQIYSSSTPPPSIFKYEFSPTPSSFPFPYMK